VTLPKVDGTVNSQIALQWTNISQNAMPKEAVGNAMDIANPTTRIIVTLPSKMQEKRATTQQTAQETALRISRLLSTNFLDVIPTKECPVRTAQGRAQNIVLAPVILLLQSSGMVPLIRFQAPFVIKTYLRHFRNHASTKYLTACSFLTWRISVCCIFSGNSR